MSGSREVAPAAWVSQLSTLREDGWTVFDWLGVVAEPHDALDDGSRDEAGWHRLVVQLLRPRAGGNGHGQPAGYGRLQVQTRIPPGGSAPSLTRLWPGAAWHEREAWEMFGLAFDGFADHTGLGLRPLLLDGLDGLDGQTAQRDRGSPKDVPVPPYPPPLRKAALLPARVGTPWPGSVEPGESPSQAFLPPNGGPGATGDATRGARRGSRRRQRPLGVPAPAPGPEDPS